MCTETYFLDKSHKKTRNTCFSVLERCLRTSRPKRTNDRGNYIVQNLRNDAYIIVAFVFAIHGDPLPDQRS